MTTTKITVYAILLTGIVLTACRKDRYTQHVTEPAKQLVKIIYSADTANPTSFRYDAIGRLSDVESSNMHVNYSYAGNLLSITFTDSTNYIYSSFTNGILDNAGRVTQMDGHYTPKIGQPVDYRYYFTYDTDGYLIKQTATNLVTNKTAQDVYTYSNGNLVSDVYSIDGQHQYRLEFTYHDNLPNKISLDIPVNIISFVTDGITGKRSRNLRKSMTNYNSQHIKILDHLYAYDLDSQGWPLKMKIKNLLISYDSEIRYSYNK